MRGGGVAGRPCTDGGGQADLLLPPFFGQSRHREWEQRRVRASAFSTQVELLRVLENFSCVFYRTCEDIQVAD